MSGKAPLRAATGTLVPGEDETRANSSIASGLSEVTVMTDTARLYMRRSDACGEGLISVAGQNALYWVDINGFKVHRLSLRNDAVRTWGFDGPVSCLAETDRAGVLLLCCKDEILAWNPDTGEQTLIASLGRWPALRFNDGGCDDEGQFWVGTMSNNVGPNGEPQRATPGRGSVMRLSKDRQLTSQISGLTVPNGWLCDTDEGRVYFADSPRNELYAVDYRTGQIAASTKRSFLAGASGLPDGSAIDVDGGIWNCRFGGGQIIRIDRHGQITHTVSVPTKNPTSCSFGGEHNTTLFITSAAIFTDPNDALAGSIFSVKTNFVGKQRYKYAITDK